MGRMTGRYKHDLAEHEARLKMWRASKSDSEIAKARGVTRQAINYWRLQHHLGNPLR